MSRLADLRVSCSRGESVGSDDTSAALHKARGECKLQAGEINRYKEFRYRDVRETLANPSEEFPVFMKALDIHFHNIFGKSAETYDWKFISSAELPDLLLDNMMEKGFFSMFEVRLLGQIYAYTSVTG